MSMSETELNKRLKKKMAICAILQRKFGCRCVKKEFKVGIADVTYKPFCEAVEEVYAECQNQK